MDSRRKIQIDHIVHWRCTVRYRPRSSSITHRRVRQAIYRASPAAPSESAETILDMAAHSVFGAGQCSIEGKEPGGSAHLTHRRIGRCPIRIVVNVYVEQEDKADQQHGICQSEP